MNAIADVVDALLVTLAVFVFLRATATVIHGPRWHGRRRAPTPTPRRSRLTPARAALRGVEAADGEILEGSCDAGECSTCAGALRGARGIAEVSIGAAPAGSGARR